MTLNPEPLDGEIDEADAEALAEGSISPEDARPADTITDEDPGLDSDRPVHLEDPSGDELQVDETPDPSDA
jgi:hypothetical protein